MFAAQWHSGLKVYRTLTVYDSYLCCCFSPKCIICFPSDEIGVIPCPEGRYNRSPIVVVENKLGVESWCVKFLLPYVHHKVLLYRQRKHWLDKEGN